MNKEELTKKIMRGLRESLNESIKPSDIYDDGKSLVDGSKDDITIASVWDDGSVKFRKSVSKEEREAYKKAILKNKKLVDRFDIKEDSFINESKAFDPRNNKNHKAAYNSFVKWFDRWKGKLDRDELRAMIKKVSADALGDNLDAINESHKNINEELNVPGRKILDKYIQYPKMPANELVDVMSKDGWILDPYYYDENNVLGTITIKLIKDNETLYIEYANKDYEYFNGGHILRLLPDLKTIVDSQYIVKKVNESHMPGADDDHQAFDIFLTYENTREIYDHYITPMADNLLIKLRKGQELSFDVLVKSSIIEKHAKVAIDEYKRINGRIMVDTATRKALKAKIAEYLIDLANDDYAFEQHDMESNLHK